MRRHATREELERVHRPSYIDFIAQTAGKTMTMLDPDTVATAETYDAARLAAGGVMNAIDSVVSGETDNAFALVRPPGHHAQAAEAAGFCIFNNIAIGARHALARHGMERILIVDWDLHHGNGTAGDLSTRTVRSSTFPRTSPPAIRGRAAWRRRGRGAGLGYTINVPLRPGADDAFYVRVFREHPLPGRPDVPSGDHPGFRRVRHLYRRSPGGDEGDAGRLRLPDPDPPQPGG